MNIIIVGAGNIGYRLASLLSSKDHNVTLIEKDPFKADFAARTLDIRSKVGSGTDWQLLEDLKELKPDLILAMTDSDETNFTICSIAKHLGYPQSIARVGQNQFINCNRLDFARIFHADYLIAPELLVANDIFKLITSPGPLVIENFAHGAVQMRTLMIPESWKKGSIKLGNLQLPEDVKIGLIRRHQNGSTHVIFPHGSDQLLPRDEVSFIGQTRAIQEIHKFFDIPHKPIKSVYIIGGSSIGLNLAKILESYDIQVKLIEKNYDRCLKLSEHLPKSTILHHDASDLSFLQQENIALADAFVTCTRTDETNLLVGKLAKEAKATKIIACIQNATYEPIATEIGIHQTIALHKSCENQILSIIGMDKVSRVVSLYENSAEIMEVKVQSSTMTGIPISELAKFLPQDFLFAAIHNRGRIMIANGQRILSPGDTVITITHPKHITMLRNLF